MSVTTNLAITRLVTHKLQLTLADDNVSPIIKEFIQKILDNKVKLQSVMEDKKLGRVVYMLSDSTFAILDMSDDMNELSYHGCTWQEIPEDEVDCQWAVQQHDCYLAMTDCLVYLAASFEQ